MVSEIAKQHELPTRPIALFQPSLMNGAPSIGASFTFIEASSLKNKMEWVTDLPAEFKGLSIMVGDSILDHLAEIL